MEVTRASVYLERFGFSPRLCTWYGKLTGME